MPVELLITYLKLPTFGLVAARLAGVILFMPVLGGLSVPPTVRALLVIGLAGLVTPLLPFEPLRPATLAELVLALGRELLLGIVIGLALQLVFVGVQLGGMLIAQESGLAYASVIDPTGVSESESVISMLYLQLAVVTYLVIGGQRALLAALLDSFAAVPLLGAADATPQAAQLLIEALQAGFELGLRVAAPAVLTMFLINLVLGFLSRTVPQLNTMVLGFSIKTLVALLVMAVSLPTAMSLFVDGLEVAMAQLPELWKRAG